MSRFNLHLGASVSSWLLAALVIAAELSAPFKSALVAVFTHHWIAKFVLTALAFAVFGFLLKDRDSLAGIKDGKLAWYSVLGSLAVMLAFYVFEFVA